MGGCLVYWNQASIKDPLSGGHNRNNLSTKDTQIQMFISLLLLVHFEPQKSGQPNKMAGPNVRVLCLEVLLHKSSHKHAWTLCIEVTLGTNKNGC